MLRVTAIAVLPDDRIVVAGESLTHEGQLLFLTPSGKLDHSRGKNGALVLPATNPFDQTEETFTIQGLAAAPDGSIYVAGLFDAENGFDLTVARIAPNGRLDKTFGTNGEFISPAKEESNVDAESLVPRFITLRSDGDILVQVDDSNTQFFQTSPQFVLLSSSGQQQPFNYFSLTDGFSYGAATLKDGPLFSLEGDSSDLKLIKYDLAGNYDPHFATHGAIDVGPYDNNFPPFQSSVDVGPDGKAIVGLGTTLTRVDGKTGALDPTFGVNGVVSNTGKLIGFGSSGALLTAIVPASDATVILERRFADEGPAGLLSATRISVAPPTPYKFMVHWRDDDGVDAASLSNGLRIIGPDGNTYKARLLGTIAQDANALFAVYKIGPPGGTWSAVDDGTYTVRVREGKVRDINGGFMPAMNLGTFEVEI
jgi:hypothetical protein